MKNLSASRNSLLSLDNIGPDWQAAQNFGKACKPGIPRTSNTAYCQFSMNPIQKDPIPMCGNSKQLGHLGYGYPLYFIFVKYLIVLMMIELLSYSGIGIIKALESSYSICERGGVIQLPGGIEGQCTSWLIRFMRVEYTVSTEQIGLRLMSFVLQLAVMVYVRDAIRKTRAYYEQRNISLKHYSILVSQIPPQLGTTDKITRLVKDKIDPDLQVEDVILISDLEQLYESLELKQQLVKEQQECKNKPDEPDYEQKIKEIDTKIKKNEDFLKEEIEKQMELLKEDQAQVEKAIVVLKTQTSRDRCLQRFEEFDKEQLKELFGQGGEEIQMRVAPQPREIIWQSFNYPNNKRLLRVVAGWVITGVFLTAVTFIFYALIRAKTQQVDEMLKHDPVDQSAALAASLGTLIGVVIFDKFIMAPVLHIITDYQKHDRSSHFQYSFMLKYVLGLFFTTALMTLLVEDLAFSNIYSQHYGVAQAESMMFFLDGFFIPIIWFVHPWWILRRIKRWYYDGKLNLTQRKANFYMQDPNYSLGKKYAQIIQAFWLAYFYDSMLPGGTVIIFLGLICYYWADKFSLLHRSSVEENVSGQLSVHTVKLIDFALVLKPAGDLIFDSQIRMSGVEWTSILMLCVGLVYLLLPMDDILDYFHYEEFKPHRRNYKEVKEQFTDNYRTLNPLFTEQRVQHRHFPTTKRETSMEEFMNNSQPLVLPPVRAFDPSTTHKVHVTPEKATHEQQLSMTNQKFLEQSA